MNPTLPTVLSNATVARQLPVIATISTVVGPSFASSISLLTLSLLPDILLLSCIRSRRKSLIKVFLALLSRVDSLLAALKQKQ